MSANTSSYSSSVPFERAPAARRSNIHPSSMWSFQSYHSILALFFVLSSCYSLSTSRLHPRSISKAGEIFKGVKEADSVTPVKTLPNPNEIPSTFTPKTHLPENTKRLPTDDHLNYPSPILPYHDPLPVTPEHAAAITAALARLKQKERLPPQSWFAKEKTEEQKLAAQKPIPEPGIISRPQLNQPTISEGRWSAINLGIKGKGTKRIGKNPITGGRTTTAESGRAQRAANNKWSQIRGKLPTWLSKGITKVAKKITQVKLWFSRLNPKPTETSKTGAETAETAETTKTVQIAETAKTAKAPEEFAISSFKLGKFLGGSRVGDLELPDMKPFGLANVGEYLAHGLSDADKKKILNFLELLKDHRRSLDEISTIQSKFQLAKEAFDRTTQFEQRIHEDVASFIKALNIDEFRKEFNSEYEAAIESIVVSGMTFKSKPNKYFPMMEADVKEPDFPAKDFSRARAAQFDALKVEYDEKSSLTPQYVFRTLRQDVGLKAELFRYCMWEEFDKILAEAQEVKSRSLESIIEVNPQVVQRHLEGRLEELFKSPLKDDKEWYESLFTRFNSDGLTPSEVFNKLRTVNSPDRIRYALDTKRASLFFLTDKDYEALRQALSSRLNFRQKLEQIEAAVKKRHENLAADQVTKLKKLDTNWLQLPLWFQTRKSVAKKFPFLLPHELQALRKTSNRAAFRRKLAEVEESVKQRNDEKLKHELEEIHELRTEAMKLNPVNYRYSDQLLKEGLIDKATRAELSVSSQLQQDKFQEILMTQFRQKLLQIIKSGTVEDDQIKSQASSILVSKYMAQLNREAKTFYLTPDAILKPNSFRFGDALKVYDPKKKVQLKTMESTKAYLEAYFDIPKPVKAPRSLSGLLDALKLPSISSDALHDGRGAVILKKLPGFDTRLDALWKHPLEARDPRLRGTQYEDMSEGARQSINNFIESFFPNLDKLDATVRKEDKTAQKITEIQASFSTKEKQRMRSLLGALKATRYYGPDSDGRFTEEQLAAMNKLIGSKKETNEPKQQPDVEHPH